MPCEPLTPFHPFYVTICILAPFLLFRYSLASKKQELLLFAKARLLDLGFYHFEQRILTKVLYYALELFVFKLCC